MLNINTKTIITNNELKINNDKLLSDIWSIDERKFLSPLYTVSIDDQKIKDLLLSIGFKSTFSNKLQYQNCMKMIIANKFKAKDWIYFCRDFGSYSKNLLKKEEWYNPRVVLRLIDFLIENEYLTKDTFNLSRKLKQNKKIASLFLYTPKFIELIKSNFSSYELKVIKNENFIYSLSITTHNTFQITSDKDFCFLDGSYAGTQTRYRKLDELGNPEGRLINSLVILPKELANELDLGDRSGNAYLDFSGMFLSMQYALDGSSEIPSDIYSLSITTHNTFERSVIKRIVNTSLFAKNKYTSTFAVNKQISKDNIKNNTKIPNITKEDVKNVLSNYPQDFFFKKENMKLFSLEGEIGTKIIQKCNELNIQVFDKYDGFICGLKHKDQVEKIMIESFQEVLKTNMIPKVKSETHLNELEPIVEPLQAPTSLPNPIEAQSTQETIKAFIEPPRVIPFNQDKTDYKFISIIEEKFARFN